MKHQLSSETQTFSTHLARPESVQHAAPDVIPPPLNLPWLNRRQFIKLSLTAAMLATMPMATLIAPHSAQAAPPVDETGPIGRKWVKLGGESVVGAPTADIITIPGGAAQYQTFEKGVIIYSVDFGAMLVSTAIFAKWLSLNTQVNGKGENLLTYVGFPCQDYGSTPTVEIAYFERGMIIVQLDTGLAYTVYGVIYEHYWRYGVFDLPTAEESNAANGGRYQSFARFDIYWHEGSGAFEVHGSIRQRWLDLGGAGGMLGYPLSDEESVIQAGVEIGRTSRFEKGVIYYSDATGAWEVMGEIRKAYENQYGGPTLAYEVSLPAPPYTGTVIGLGFPTSGQGTTPTSGGVFNNFQNGLLVYHNGGTYNGVWAFRGLDLYLQRFEGTQNEGLCGEIDLYAWFDVQITSGGVMREINERRPGDGDSGSGFDLTETIPLVSVVQSDLEVKIGFEGWDADSFLCGSDDKLGNTGYFTFTIDNLWGLFAGGSYTASSDEGSFTVTFSIKNPLPYDPTRFRQQLWWSFDNFQTPELTYDQFAATFSDVGRDESAWFHPFNHLYYQTLYKRIAKGGNCFGMSLESIFAETGRSLYAEPIIRFWPDTQAGQKLNPANPIHKPTINELNIKQGYQLGADCVERFLDLLRSNETHNPRQCFLDSQAAAEAGDYPLLSVSEGILFGSSHTVRPYHWDRNDPNHWVIYIADPNNPVGKGKADNAPGCRIDIDPNANSFDYQFKEGEIWSGNGFVGGRLFFIPFSLVSNTPRTLFEDIFARIAGNMSFFLSASAQTQQITDEAGRTLYEPGLSGPPTRWDQIRQDDSARIPNLARIPFFGADSDVAPLELYYGRPTGATLTHAIAGITDSSPLTPKYEWVMNSATLAARLFISGTAVADLITVQEIGMPTKAVTVTIPTDSETKTIAWTMAGPVKTRWVELNDLNIAPGQSITIRLANSGYETTINNNGPTTTADLQVQPGPGATRVAVGTITLVGGATTIFKFDRPLTTLNYTGGTPGRGDWLVSVPIIALTAVDFNDKGIRLIEYSKDGSNWTPFSTPFAYTDEGATKLYYRATDNAGDQEGANSRLFKIDTQPPQTVLTIGDPQTGGDPLLVTPATPFSVTAVDSASGVESIWYRFFPQGTPASAYITSPGNSVQFNLAGPNGVYEVHTGATDMAGNVETPHIQLVRLDSDTLPSSHVYLPLVKR